MNCFKVHRAQFKPQKHKNEEKPLIFVDKKNKMSKDSKVKCKH